MKRLKATFPKALQFLFQPAPYKVGYGGRGSAKSWSFAKALLLNAYQPATKPYRILCAREYQNSIQDSVHALLRGQISDMGLDSWFTITDKSITAWNGNEFIFKGLHNNVQSIRSAEGVKYCWVEEAANVSKASWEVLLPTLFRVEGGELWVSFNPVGEKDDTYQRFVAKPPSGAIVRKVSWRDNPWVPKAHLEQMEHMRGVDYEAYLHVWEGECRTQSDAQVLRGKIVVQSMDVGPDWHGPYQGADWGFSRDPTTLIRCWLTPDQRSLYIEYEFYGVGVDTDKLPSLFSMAVPDSAKHITYGDNARPETVSQLQHHGYPHMQSCKKWKGSVEDGVAYLRQFDQIIIHHRCVHAIEEGGLYSYKIRKNDEVILPEVEDRHNHIWDAVRYALQPLIMKKLPPSGYFNPNVFG